MLTDILRLPDHHLDRLILALSRGEIGPEATLSQVRKLGFLDHPERILAWISEAFAQFGSTAGISAVLRLILEDRGRTDRASSLPELILTGPEAEEPTGRDTRVVVREIFETVRDSILILGYAFHGSDVIFEPLARRMGENADLLACLVVNIDPKKGQPPEQTIARFSEKFLRSSWPFHPRPRIYFLPGSVDDRGATRASVHAKAIIADRETVYIGSANFTGAAFHRNIEAGVCIRDRRLGDRLSTYFERMVDNKVLKLLID